VANLNADKLDGLDSIQLESHDAATVSFPGTNVGTVFFTSHATRDVIVTVYGSGYSTVPNRQIGLDAQVDGGSVVPACRIFTNEANSHKACAPRPIFLNNLVEYPK
jgi:hypothetical protein